MKRILPDARGRRLRGPAAAIFLAIAATPIVASAEAAQGALKHIEFRERFAPEGTMSAQSVVKRGDDLTRWNAGLMSVRITAPGDPPRLDVKRLHAGPLSAGARGLLCGVVRTRDAIYTATFTMEIAGAVRSPTWINPKAGRDSAAAKERYGARAALMLGVVQSDCGRPETRSLVALSLNDQSAPARDRRLEVALDVRELFVEVSIRPAAGGTERQMKCLGGAAVSPSHHCSLRMHDAPRGEAILTVRRYPDDGGPPQARDFNIALP